MEQYINIINRRFPMQSRRTSLLLTLILSLLFLSGCGLRDATPQASIPTVTIAAEPSVPEIIPATDSTEIESDAPTATAETESSAVETPETRPPEEVMVPSAPEGITPIASIYNEEIPATHAERIIISEIFLMLEAGELLLETDWDGTNDMELPITIDQFDQASLEAYIEDESQDDSALTIPSDLEDFYISDEGAAEVQAIILEANGEYTAYLEAQAVLPIYIDELGKVMPATAERMTYHPINDPNADPTAVEALDVSGGDSDHSRLQMNVYPVDIYNRTLLLEHSRILGEPPEDEEAYAAYHLQLRDMATRQLVYHEMTHAVQRAYTNLHVEDEEERTRSGSWLYASKTLLADVDTQYHWTWGDPFFAQTYNNDVSGESQAEGISYEMFVNLYDMSNPQKAAVWDHYFGRYEESRAALTASKALYEEAYPEFSPDQLGDLLPEVMDHYPNSNGSRVLWQVAFRLIALPAYVGYLNPMEPDDTPKFWGALREP
jgi:hypothetical protein